MNFWRDNFIGNMYGPLFLLFYAAVIGVVLALSRWRVWSADRTLEERVDDPPEPVGSTDVALLRGSVNEVLRLTVVELVQRGYLRVVEGTILGMKTSQKIAQASMPPDPRHLSRLQRPVFDFFQSPRNASALFSDRSLKEWFRTECGESEKNLELYRLITPDDVVQKSRRIALLAGSIVLGLGVYKLMVAFSKGRTNIGFLVVMLILGTVGAILVSKAPRISRRGKAYIEKLRVRYSRLKVGLTGLTHAIDDPALIFAVALFGITTLEGTPYSNLVTTFRQATSQAGASSGGCGGSGCGGGGCGGGGCGGCGGG
jgi:uncharacterized protein (TIGR04222 family)